MNKGAFCIYGEQLLLIDYNSSISLVPFELIGNGMVIKENGKLYKMKKVGENRVTDFLKIVQDGVVVENPFEYSTDSEDSLDGRYFVSDQEKTNFAEPAFKDIEKELIEIGFIKTDRVNFGRERYR